MCHLFTANSLLAVTVITAGVTRPGWVLAATWVTGELDGNFRTMMTSCWAWSVNINGLCRRRHYWMGMTRPPDRKDETKTGERQGAGKEEGDHVNTRYKWERSAQKGAEEQQVGCVGFPRTSLVEFLGDWVRIHEQKPFTNQEILLAPVPPHSREELQE